jgi:diguanylate cyclase (GGDEF)-like protein
MTAGPPNYPEPGFETLPYTAVLNALPDASFDRIARLAARHFQTALASITFFDGQRQWLKARHGLEPLTGGAGAAPPLCRLVLEHGELLWTSDARQDARFAAHPHVVGGLNVRFYASAPLRSPDGEVVGALCVADPEPRTSLDAEDCLILEDLAALVTQELHLRWQTRRAEWYASGEAEQAGELRDALRLAHTLQGVTDLEDLGLAPAELLRHGATLTAAALQADWGGLSSVEDAAASTTTVWSPGENAALARIYEDELDWASSALLWAAVDRAGLHLGQTSTAARTMSLAVGGQGDHQAVLTVARSPDGPAWRAPEQHLFTAVTQRLRQALERRAEQLSLAATQQHLRVTLNAGPLVLWATDAQGVFTLSEGRGLSDVGLVPGAAVGHAVEELYAGADSVIQNVRRALGGEQFTGVVQVGPRFFESSYTPLYGEDQRICGSIGVAYDVTARQEAEVEQQRARTNAEALVALSRVLETDDQAAQVAEAALAALEPALKDMYLVLWERHDDLFLPLAVRGVRPAGVRPEDWPGLPVASLAPYQVMSGRRSFLVADQLSDQARSLGLVGMALLPVLIDLNGHDLLLHAACTGTPRAWQPAEQELLETAARTLSAWASRRVERQMLEHSTRTDVLTGLGNRRAFEEDLSAVLSSAAQSGEATGLLTVDLDGLKRVNDSEGHGRGDQLLRRFGEALGACFQAGDRVYRLGGDEYVIILPHATVGDTEHLTERLEQAVAQVAASGFSGVGASAGLAYAPGEGSSLTELLSLSDARMYQHKLSKRQHRPAAQTQILAQSPEQA